jgi:general secretion pathway protein G
VRHLHGQSKSQSKRGDTVKAAELPGRRVTLSPPLTRGSAHSRGFTLIELVITVTVLSILTLGIVPLMKLSVKRQKEEQLRAALRQMRSAIDEFHRDTAQMVCTPGAPVGGAPPPGYIDPRSKVVISDCTIFGVDNIDRYPPDLDTLVSGVNVVPRMSVTIPGSQLSTKKKVYLRGIPIDPMTGEAEWEFRSCYDEADSDSWGGENVFDVRSKSKDTALNGEKYSDW